MSKKLVYDSKIHFQKWCKNFRRTFRSKRTNDELRPFYESAYNYGYEYGLKAKKFGKEK